MKGLCLVFLAMLLLVIPVASLNGQAIKAELSTGGWSKIYIGTGVDEAHALVQTVDGGYALAGYNSSFGYNNRGDFWLVKTDANGNEQWNSAYGGTDDDNAYAMVQTIDGGYALAGWTNSFGAGGYDFWLVKTDANGNEQWNKTYGETGGDGAKALVQTVDGGYALAGNGFAKLIKTDASGNLQWNKTYGGDWVEALVQTGDGGYALAGNTYSSSYDFWLVKTDANGNEQWSNTYGGQYADYAYALVQTTDGGYALAGYTESFGAGRDDFWLVKTDASGNMQWNKTYGGTEIDDAFALVQTIDGGYALAGYTTSFGLQGDFWLVKTDANGNEQWNNTYGEPYADGAEALVQTVDGGYALAGWTNSYSTSEDFWLVKTDASGVVPEFPSPMIFAALFVVVSSAVILAKRKFRGSPRKSY